MTAAEREDTELVLSELDPFQKDIEAGESESIEARWDFGRVLLTHRAGKKQLPTGLRPEITKEYRLEASEITRRMRLAEKFTTRKQVVDACTRCGGSWRRMIREELTKREAVAPKPWDYRINQRLNMILDDAETDEQRKTLAELLRKALDRVEPNQDVVRMDVAS